MVLFAYVNPLHCKAPCMADDLFWEAEIFEKLFLLKT
jgi:hypothetical protein